MDRGYAHLASHFVICSDTCVNREVEEEMMVRTTPPSVQHCDVLNHLSNSSISSSILRCDVNSALMSCVMCNKFHNNLFIKINSLTTPVEIQRHVRFSGQWGSECSKPNFIDYYISELYLGNNSRKFRY